MCKRSFHEEYVPVMFVHNHGEAEFYRSLLEDHDIPVVVEDEEEVAVGVVAKGADIPIMVPREQQEDAEVIIEQRITSDEEFDLNFHGYHHDDDDLGDDEVAVMPDEAELLDIGDDADEGDKD